MRHSRGFTLVELMIVVAIIGILAAIGIPAYQDYLARGQMTEAVELLGGGKTPMAEYFGAHAQWPAAASSVMPVTSGRYVSQILMDHPGGTMRDLTLTAVMKGVGSSINPNLAGRTLLLTTADGGANWNCTKGTVPSQYLPGSCK